MQRFFMSNFKSGKKWEKVVKFWYSFITFVVEVIYLLMSTT